MDFKGGMSGCVPHCLTLAAPPRWATPPRRPRAPRRGHWRDRDQAPLAVLGPLVVLIPLLKPVHRDPLLRAERPDPHPTLPIPLNEPAPLDGATPHVTIGIHLHNSLLI